MTPTSENRNSDPRLADMLEVIFSYAAGDLKARGTLSDDDSALDGVMAGINILGEELEANRAQIQQASELLRQALEYAQTLIRSSPDGILAVDRDLRITEWNLLMEQMCGQVREQAIGRILDEIPFMQETGEAARIRDGFDGGDIQLREFAYRIPGADKLSFFEFLAAPLRNQTGQIQGAVVRIRDITERKWAEEQSALGVVVCARPDRGRHGPAGDNQRDRQNHGRERGGGKWDRRAARTADRQ